MKIKSIVSLLLVFILLFSAVTPAFAAVSAADEASAVSSGEDFFGSISEFFKTMFESIKAFFDRIGAYFEVKREGVKKTMNKNAVHMLKSVTDTICDSFIITTEDGKVIVIDGGHRTETGYFIEYLKAVTGQKIPKIDAWFLSHPHTDHVEVFNEVAESRTNQVIFDKVLLNYAPVELYESRSQEEGMQMVGEFNRISKTFPEKVQILNTGDIFNIGAAKITVLYTADTSFIDVNEHSVIFRMDLGGKSFMFTGDAGVNAGNYVVGKYGESGILDCDICKMAHHGQDGVDRNFYEAVSPEICLWPTPSWVWDNRNGNLKTLEVRAWIDELGVKRNYVAKDGSFSMFISNPRIVTTTDVFEEGYSAEKAVDRLAGIGFEGIDMGFDYWVFDGSPFLSDGYLDWARSLKKHADEAGIPYTHAHAPGEADVGDVIGRSIEAASVLGAKYCVIHPVWKDENGKTIESKSKFISVNAEAIKKWLPLAEKCGVILLSENILWGASKDPRIISELVKEVDSKWFGWCFDVGHAHCSGFSPDVLRNCAVIPASLHIQDNDGSGDGHLIPGDGTIDWDKFIEILKEIGYTGDCVMEAHHQSLVAPDEERDAILKRLLSESEKLRTAMEY